MHMIAVTKRLMLRCDNLKLALFVELNISLL
jgi:hypothetical protein